MGTPLSLPECDGENAIEGALEVDSPELCMLWLLAVAAIGTSTQAQRAVDEAIREAVDTPALTPLLVSGLPQEWHRHAADRILSLPLEWLVELLPEACELLNPDETKVLGQRLAGGADGNAGLVGLWRLAAMMSPDLRSTALDAVLSAKHAWRADPLSHSFGACTLAALCADTAVDDLRAAVEHAADSPVALAALLRTRHPVPRRPPPDG